MIKDKPTYEELESKIAELEKQIAFLQLKSSFQNQEKKKRADELAVANIELNYQTKEKKKRASELIIANIELASQNEQKKKRAADLVIANVELAFQTEEKAKRAAELVIANVELAFQNEEKGKRAAELIISKIKNALQNEAKEKIAAELIIADLALALQAELIIAKEKVADNERRIEALDQEYKAASEDLKQTGEALLIAKEKSEESQQKIGEQNEEIKLNSKRLQSLLRISRYQTKSTQDLFDYALGEAINLTSSKIGNIYFFDETTQRFKLNSWSKEVMKECSVMNPPTFCDLDTTGCWGEAVRQRQAIIINNYQSDNPYNKGTSEVDVSLLRLLITPVVVDNKIVAIIGVANKAADYNESDIRQLSLLMNKVWEISERAVLIENLEAAKKRAEESDTLKTAFLQNLSHEIRTPMNAIVGFSKMLEKPGLSAEKRKSFTTIIVNTTNQLLAVVSDILTISSLETKQEKASIKKVCINNIIVDLLAEFKTQASNQNISIYTKQALSDRASEIYTDDIKLRQTLGYLISNALKFTHEGFIEFGYNLKLEIEPGEIKFYVSDTGIGISNELHDKIFERFTQVELEISKRYSGTGLGLSISKGFVELLGGKIWVQSELGKGSTFYFTIPYNPAHLIDKNDLPTKQTGNKTTVLIAEDEEYNYLLLEELLNDMNLILIHAKNGLEAVEICRNNQSIDVV